MGHYFKYTLKTLFKNKALIFWTFAFPIIMALLFNLAFSNIDDSEKLEVFDIAIVDNEEFRNNKIFKDTFASLSDDKNENKIFNIEYVTENKAKNLLENDKIVGYLSLNNGEHKIVTTSSGVYETILKYVVDEINENIKMMSTLTEIEIRNGNIDEEKIAYEIKSLLEENNEYIKDISDNNLSYILVEYYSLIAMTCLYGGIIIMTAMNQTLANMSSIGKRVNVTPIKRSKMILSSILASFIIELIGVAILMLFLILGLKVDFGDNLLLVLLLSVIGTFAGLSLGLFISVMVKAHENTKTGIIIAISMALSILSGMTGVTLKYIIDKNVPFINKLNPASMITDGFYSLYYYNTINRYVINAVSLLIFAILLTIISGIVLRRQKYDSI